MSKGSQVITMRFQAAELLLMDDYIAASSPSRYSGPWDRSAFIRAAVREKLQHIARSGNKALQAKLGMKQPAGGSERSGDTPGVILGPPEVQATSDQPTGGGSDSPPAKTPTT